jgi:transmembrane sensor
MTELNFRNEERIRNAIIEQATHWYVRNRDGELTDVEKTDFLTWLRASPQHTSEYMQISGLSSGLRTAIRDLKLNKAGFLEDKGWNGNDTIVAFDSVRSPQPLRRASWRVFTRTRLAGFAAAAVVCLVGLYWFMPPGFAGLPRIISVAHGEQRTVSLSDGSVVHVNASSEITVRFSKVERRVDLDHGQAMFEVAHNAARPFRVRAGATEVIAVGTQFDVYRHDSQDVTVTVVQGKVDIVNLEERNHSAGSGPNITTQPALRLHAGEQVQVGSAGQGATPKAIDILAATAWVRREIVIEGRPLSDVAAEINRYVPKPIEIDDSTLKDLQVSGVFDAYDSDSFLAFLRQYDVEIEEVPNSIRVRARTHH